MSSDEESSFQQFYRQYIVNINFYFIFYLNVLAEEQKLGSGEILITKQKNGGKK